MNDDNLNRLKNTAFAAPSPDAKKRALEAALLAFDAEQAKKSATVPQGTGWGTRLRSIVNFERGTWTMNNRLAYGVGTAAVALLLLPLGYQLFNSTALTPIGAPPVNRPQVVDQPTPQPHVAQQPSPEPKPLSQPETKLKTGGPAITIATGSAPTDGATPLALQVPANAKAATPMTPPLEEHAAVESDVVPAVAEPAQVDDLDALASKDEGRDLGLASRKAVAQVAAPATPPLDANLAAGTLQGGAVGNVAAPVAVASESVAVDATVAAMPNPVPASATMVNAPSTQPSATEPSGDQFTHFTESPVKVVAEQPVSTFSIDVDTASYSYVRNALQNGWLPEPDAVRLEEMINYFNYNYPGPDSAGTPFKPTVTIMPTPWNSKTELVQIGIKGYVPPATEHKPANLVFLIDTSGSMDDPDKLPLLKRAFTLLVDQLNPADTVSIVVYAGSAGVVLEPTKAVEKSKILSALDNLEAGGSTAGAEGIELAYRIAEQAKIPNGINRVILATDGDFNVGIDDPEDLTNFIKGKRDSGVFLSVLGFGQGNLGDDTMQALAQNGNGNASYIDSFKEAQKVLVQQAGGTLETIAKDVKIQIEFNPAFVSEYRLIGYETRALNREDFNNDKVDAGDIGAGTTVTALYEITPAGSGGDLVDPLHFGNPAAVESRNAPAAAAPTDELAYLKLRYKLPDSDTSTLMQLPITRSMAVSDAASASDDQRFAAAVAAFGQKLRGSNYGDMSWTEIRKLAQGARGSDENGYRAEFMQLIDGAAVLAPDPAKATE